MQLDGQIVPQLINRVGDVKAGRIWFAGLEQYLDRHTMIWDRDLLRSMFDEADFKKQGSLDTPALIAALSGRFSKRKHNGSWRDLTALLLDVPELVLVEDIPRLAERAGVASDVWNVPPKPLPPVKRRVRSRDASGGEALSTSGRLGGSPAATATAASSSSFGGGGTMDALDVLLSSSTHASGAAAATACGGGEGVLLTTGGLKSTAPIPAEQAINSSIAETGRSTFAGVREFNDFSTGLQLTPALGVDRSMLAALSTSGRQAAAIPDSLASTVHSVKAWSATLPPSAISMSQSALGTLRQSIRSTTSSKPHFDSHTRRLSTTDFDKTLGLPRGDLPLSRVEPVRDTKVLYNADYVAWGGANGNDRAAPGKWINEHPSAVAAATAAAAIGTERHYPWG